MKQGSLEQKVEIRGAKDRPGFPVKPHHRRVNVIGCPLDRVPCDYANQELANVFWKGSNSKSFSFEGRKLPSRSRSRHCANMLGPVPIKPY